VTDGAPGFAVGLGLTNDCNLACAHCYRDTDRVDHLSLSDVRRVADRLPIRAVNLGTGENALHPEFSEILRELRARGIVTTLTSNGHSAAVLDDDELGWLHDLELSLDFPTEAEQDAWRGPGNWRLVLEQTERAQWLGVAVTIVAVMMRTNYDRLPALARLAIARGAAFRVNVYQPVKTDAFSLSYDEFWSGFRLLLEAAPLAACTEPIVRAVLAVGERAGGCGSTTVRVTPRGEVLPCGLSASPTSTSSGRRSSARRCSPSSTRSPTSAAPARWSTSATAAARAAGCCAGGSTAPTSSARS